MTWTDHGPLSEAEKDGVGYIVYPERGRWWLQVVTPDDETLEDEAVKRSEEISRRWQDDGLTADIQGLLYDKYRNLGAK